MRLRDHVAGASRAAANIDHVLLRDGSSNALGVFFFRPISLLLRWRAQIAQSTPLLASCWVSHTPNHIYVRVGADI
ncbi:hypothetical protein RSOLAG1IB_04421 [Rhizoctonia solani AG-1 IB]|uniref:Uncharacterized protein n=1 Tax=Thanatephorus cucumeris (strain AG1-IB / isolate 7/3/14) TaxID=1108050 RepID=A0A0B7FUP7_THACB|nr:hypothetical protein RSOLAG1IB_04421 [Rhizoctonia solani AG-1 IB]